MSIKNAVHKRAGILRDIVFSANDGIITTYAIIAGVQGASLSPRIVVILGMVNLFADSIAMATGNYLGIKSEIEYEETMGKHKINDSAFSHAIVTFLTFIVLGFIPLVPYVFNFNFAFFCSSVLVVLILLGVGFFRGTITKRGWFRSGIEMLLVGGLAAVVAYIVGFSIDKYLLSA